MRCEKSTVLRLVAVGTALAPDRSNTSPGSHSDRRQHTFPHEREAIDASRLAMYEGVLAIVNAATQVFPEA
jgi:hypothetical protein